MNKTLRKSFKFNIIDFLIVVIVIGCIAGIIFRYNIVNRIVFNGERDEVEISFLITGISPVIADSIINGDTFYSTASENSIGTLIEHSTTDAETVYADANGIAVLGYDSTKKDVRGVLSAKGVMSDEGFMLQGTQFLAPGKELTIQSLHVQVSVIITEIKEVN